VRSHIGFVGSSKCDVIFADDILAQLTKQPISFLEGFEHCSCGFPVQQIWTQEILFFFQ
jgi:hypothetical protein